MGGRGANSGFQSGGKTSGISVTYDGMTTQYYFSSHDGQNYYQRGVSEMPEPTPQNMTAQEFKRRMIASGATVSNISDSERKQAEVSAHMGKAETDKILNQAYVSEKIFTHDSRAARKSKRGSRRRI